jgi:branched-chain amino acid transport system ATP-binding protein
MLGIDGLVSGYGDDPILRGVSFDVPERSIVAVLGHNGAGKSSLVRALIGLIPVWKGHIFLAGEELSHEASLRRVRAGISVSFQDEAVFPTLSVAANLRLGAYVQRARPAWIGERLEQILSMFPQLRQLLGQPAFTLSGGERRMLSIGMALMSDPKLLILDEPSTGLSPGMAEFVFETIVGIRDQFGKAVLLVEQNVEQALRIVDRVVVLKTGAVIFDGPPSKLAADSSELVSMF